MTILIHIGPPKTGTSAIQKALKIAEKNNYFKLNGIKYFNNRISNNDILFFIAQIESEPAREYKQNYSLNLNEYKENSFNYLNKLINQKQKQISLYISSSEYLFRINKDEIIKLQNNLLELDNDIRVITFIRDPLKQYVSQFSENIKNSTKLTLPLETNHYKQLLLWKEIFKENFYVFNFEKYSISGSILFKFEDLINDLLKENNKNKIQLKKGILENQSFSAELAYAIYKFRKINNLVDNKYYNFLNFAAKKVSHIYSSNKLILTSEAKNEFIKNNKNLYKLLEKKYKFEFKYDINKSLNSKKIDIYNFDSFDSIIDNYDRKISEIIYNFLNEEIKKHKLPIQLFFLLKNFLKRIYSKLSKLIPNYKNN